MRSKTVKFLLSGLVALLVFPLLGCSLMPTQTPTTTLTREQSIALILASSVPYTDHYYKETVGEEEYQALGGVGTVTPSGEWNASYEDGKWTVQGTVKTTKWGNCLTTWTLDEGTGDVELIGFQCE